MTHVFPVEFYVAISLGRGRLHICRRRSAFCGDMCVFNPTVGGSTGTPGRHPFLSRRGHQGLTGLQVGYKRHAGRQAFRDHPGRIGSLPNQETSVPTVLGKLGREGNGGLQFGRPSSIAPSPSPSVVPGCEKGAGRLYLGWCLATHPYPPGVTPDIFAPTQKSSVGLHLVVAHASKPV